MAESILRARTVYIENDRYTTEIKEGLSEVIKQNKEKFHEVYDKKKD